MDALVSSAESFSDSKVSFCTRRKDVLSETQNSYRVRNFRKKNLSHVGEFDTIRKLLFTEVFSLHNIIYNKIIITVYPLLHKMKENEDDLERILAELIAQNAELEVCYI